MILGGLVAGIFMFIGDGIVHGVLLRQSWMGVIQFLGRQPPANPGEGMPYHLLYGLGKGFAAAFLYAAMRPRFGQGVKTAAIAGLAVWALAIPIPLCGLIPSHFFGRMHALMWSIYTIVPSLIAAIAGAWLYKEAD
jgi:hypothetical protein